MSVASIKLELAMQFTPGWMRLHGAEAMRCIVLCPTEGAGEPDLLIAYADAETGRRNLLAAKGDSETKQPIVRSQPSADGFKTAADRATVEQRELAALHDQIADHLPDDAIFAYWPDDMPASAAAERLRHIADLIDPP